MRTILKQNSKGQMLPSKKNGCHKSTVGEPWLQLYYSSHRDAFASTVGVEIARHRDWYFLRRLQVFPRAKPQPSLFKPISRAQLSAPTVSDKYGTSLVSLVRPFKSLTTPMYSHGYWKNISCSSIRGAVDVVWKGGGGEGTRIAKMVQYPKHITCGLWER